jgi:uncharacterized membrane protein
VAEARIKIARTLCLTLWAAMFFGFGLWQWIRPGEPSYLFWVVQWLPLLMVAPGLWRNNPRIYIGACFIVLLYFVNAVGGMFRPDPYWIDYWTLVASVLLFCSATMTARWLQRVSSIRSAEPTVKGSV